MSPSSTSSSERAPRGGLDLRAAGLAVALLVALELLVARSPRLWGRAPNTMFGAFQAIEREVLANAPPPAIVFVGSSRMRDAVAPRSLEAELGLQRGDVMNVGLTGGTPFEALQLYVRHRELLRQARVLVVGVEDWYWNEGVTRNEVELAFATFDDRVAWARRRHEVGPVVGGIWRTYELQDPLLKWASSFVTGVKRVTFHEDRVVWRPESAVREVGPKDTDVDGAIAHVMQKFELGPRFGTTLDELVALAREDGLEVVLVQLPLRASYRQALDRRHPTMQPYLRARVEELARAHGARVALFENAAEVGIPDDRFYDYGHLTEDGVRRMNVLWRGLVGPLLDPSLRVAKPQ